MQVKGKKILSERVSGAARKTKSRKVLPKIPDTLPGAVCAQRVRCGRANCRCKSGSDALHGPYFYHFWREAGRLKKRYLKPDEVEAMRQACERDKMERARRASYRRNWRRGLPRELRELWREVEAALKATAP